MTVGRSSALRVRLSERRQLALQLRETGVNYRDIAKAVRDELRLEKYSTASAHRDVMLALREIADSTEGSAREVLVLELTRLDAMWSGIYPLLVSGNLEAIDRGLRIMERRARYLGLDRAARYEVTGQDGGPVQVQRETEYDPRVLELWERVLLECAAGDAGPGPADSSTTAPAAGAGAAGP